MYSIRVRVQGLKKDASLISLISPPLARNLKMDALTSYVMYIHNARVVNKEEHIFRSIEKTSETKLITSTRDIADPQIGRLIKLVPVCLHHKY